MIDVCLIKLKLNQSFQNNLNYFKIVWQTRESFVAGFPFYINEWRMLFAKTIIRWVWRKIFPLYSWMTKDLRKTIMKRSVLEMKVFYAKNMQKHKITATHSARKLGKVSFKISIWRTFATDNKSVWIVK